MDYRFTAILIIMLTLLAFCAGPACPRNEYLNSYPNEGRNGEVDVSVSNRDYEYDNYDRSWNESNSQEVRLTFRKYLGNLQCNERNDLALENVQTCLLYTSPSPRDRQKSRMPSSA